MSSFLWSCQDFVDILGKEFKFYLNFILYYHINNEIALHVHYSSKYQPLSLNTCLVRLNSFLYQELF